MQYPSHSHSRLRAQNDITLTTIYKTNLSSFNLELTVMNDRFINYTYENGDVMLIYFGFKRPQHRARGCNQARIICASLFCIPRLKGFDLAFEDSYLPIFVEITR